MGPGGALEAAIEAREQGLVRFIGVTGHEIAMAEMHLRSLARFDFDSVLLPYNYPIMQNPQYAANFEQVVALCRERNVAVQTIKGIQRRAWGDRTPTYAHVVRAVGGAGRHRPGRQLRAGPARHLPQHRRRHQRPAEGAGRGQPVRAGALRG